MVVQVVQVVQSSHAEAALVLTGSLSAPVDLAAAGGDGFGRVPLGDDCSEPPKASRPKRSSKFLAAIGMVQDSPKNRNPDFREMIARLLQIRETASPR